MPSFLFMVAADGERAHRVGLLFLLGLVLGLVVGVPIGLISGRVIG